MVNCSKCDKEIAWIDTVWCDGCGMIHCTECATRNLPEGIDALIDLDLFEERADTHYSIDD